jgi:hypothetical protein
MENVTVEVTIIPFYKVSSAYEIFSSLPAKNNFVSSASYPDSAGSVLLPGLDMAKPLSSRQYSL